MSWKPNKHFRFNPKNMVSLGELTAGIAHEIQNPLNFVNNFSEINAELIEEVKEERRKEKGESGKWKGERGKEKVKLLTYILKNEAKINHHGQRADAIVKGMLQHSRSSEGRKEPTYINALCDEYLRLAYHGMRAKDKSFNVIMETDFDPSLPLVEVVPQDMGRVVLNLITNAFYLVAESKNGPREHAPLKIDGTREHVPLERGDGTREHVPLEEDPYNATVGIATKRVDTPLGDALSLSKRAGGERGMEDPSIEIRVIDNGPGIPPDILDKIFQPFFTTKPTGEGTGLGLSLSYDIVKAHGGELKVQSALHAQSIAQESGQAGVKRTRGSEPIEAPDFNPGLWVD